jgi:hypothetical protein
VVIGGQEHEIDWINPYTFNLFAEDQLWVFCPEKSESWARSALSCLPSTTGTRLIPP